MGGHSAATAEATQPYQQLAREHARLHLLYQTAQQLTATADLNELLGLVTRASMAGTRAQSGSVLLHSGRGRVMLYSSATHGRRAPDVVTLQIAREGLAAWVLTRRQAALVEDAREDPRWLPHPAGERVRSAMAAPLLRGSRVRGVLTVVHQQAAFFNHDDLDLLGELARQASLHIENARLLMAVSDERRKLETAVSAMDEGLLLVDDSGRLEQANPRALDLLGSARRPATLARLSPGLANLLDQAREHAAQGLPPLRAELEVGGPTPRQLHVTISGMSMQAEESSWWTINLHDITALKEYDQLKTRFVATASHELRTPLANLKIYASLMRHGAPSQHDHYLTTMTAEVSRLEALVEDLLTLSRLDSGTLSSHVRQLSLAPLVDAIVETYRPLVAERQIALRVAHDPATPLVAGDHEQLSRVLINLLSNAVKFTPANGQIEIQTRPAERAGQPGVALVVSDNGVGIDAADLPQIFERFRRGGQTTAPGSGLGLAIVRELLSRWGGHVSAHSQPGAGSTFTCWLPIASDPGAGQVAPQ